MRFPLRPLRAVPIFALLAMVIVLNGSSADAAGPTPVGLATAADFAVLAGTTVTNTGPTTVGGDLGVSPGSAVTGFPPGLATGSIHAADAAAAQAQADLTTAYNDAAGRTGATTVSGDLGGLTLMPGVYNASSTLGLTGTLTLDGQGDSAAVFIFQIGSALTTASASHVSLIGQASPCNVFWQVGSSATLGTGSVFAGSILALTSITAITGATVAGRTLARNGAVTLDTNTITAPSCAAVSTTTTTAPADATTTTTLPGAAVTTTTGRRPDATTTTVPGGGTTATTGPEGGVTTTTVPGVRPPLPRSGSDAGSRLAFLGLALAAAGGLLLLVGSSAGRSDPGR